MMVGVPRIPGSSRDCALGDFLQVIAVFHLVHERLLEVWEALGNPFVRVCLECESHSLKQSLRNPRAVWKNLGIFWIVNHESFKQLQMGFQQR